MNVNVDDVVKITIDGRMKERAKETSAKKLQYTIDRHDLEERNRTKRLCDIYLGDIATLAVAKWLKVNGKSFIAYDEVRTDDFKKPDKGWDLQLTKIDGSIGYCNVKSSGPDKRPITIASILKTRNLATKPSIIRNGEIVTCGEEQDFNVQVYHLPNDEDNIYLISWAKLEDLIILSPKPMYVRTISRYSLTNPRKRYDSILSTLRKMNTLLEFLKCA